MKKFIIKWIFVWLILGSVIFGIVFNEYNRLYRIPSKDELIVSTGYIINGTNNLLFVFEEDVVKYNGILDVTLANDKIEKYDFRISNEKIPSNTFEDGDKVMIWYETIIETTPYRIVGYYIEKLPNK